VVASLVGGLVVWFLLVGWLVGSHCTGHWVGKMASLTAAQNLLSTPGFKPQTVWPLASRYNHVMKAYRGSRGIAPL